jgi:hypothetical protein
MMMRLLISHRLIKLMRDFEGGARVVGKSYITNAFIPNFIGF